MGGGVSLGHTDVLHVLPHYYIKNAHLSSEECVLIRSSWTNIVENNPSHYKKEISTGNLHVSCLNWFYDSFYDRLFDVHPSSRDLFENMKQKGKMLIGNKYL